MAVAFDAVGSSTGFSTTTPSTTPFLTWTHTAGTGGGTVIVGFTWGSTGAAPTISQATYGGNAMTLLGSIQTNNAAGNGTVFLYGITGQASGANTVLIKTTANPTDEAIGNSISFTGATTFGTAVTNSGNSASATVTVSGTASGNMVVSVEAHGTNAAVTYTSGTKRFDDEVSAASGASNLSGATIAGGGGSVSLTDTITSDVWGAVAVEVQTAPVAPQSPGYPAIPLPPGWFPGSDKVTAQPGGVPFWAQPAPADATPAVIIPPTPQASPPPLPLLPPGWFPGADRVTAIPGGIPFGPLPPPVTEPGAVVFPVPEVAGIPDWLPLPPGYFPGSQTVTVDPGGIPFYAQPIPLIPALPPPPPPYIAALSGTGTAGYFTDQFGKPKFLLLEQAWALPSNAGRWNGLAAPQNWKSDIDAYFAARSAQGYTAWYGTAWSDNHVDSTALSGGRTWDGIYPIVVNGTPGKITTGTETITLNDAFWQRIDYLFHSAISRGITCFLNLGMQYDFTGSPNIWFNLSTTQASTFGQLMAARYPLAAYPNVQWFFGDDGSGGQDAYFTQMVSGLATGGDTRTMISTEQLPETNSHIEFDTGAVYITGGFGMSSTVTYNWTYTYDPTYLGVEKGYTETGTTLLPVVYGDGIWYGDNSTSQNVADYTARRVTWWALASGVRGTNVTAGPTTGGDVWQWQANAVTDLTADPNGTWITGHIGNVISYFTGLTNWHKLIPDTGNVFITAGRGTKSTNDAPGFNAAKYGDTDNYVAGSRVADGSLAVVYSGQFFSITIDQAKLGSGYTATWVDPWNLSTQSATTGSTYNSTPLGNNSQGNPDWALVFQGPAIVSTAAVPLPVVAPGPAVVQAAYW